MEEIRVSYSGKPGAYSEEALFKFSSQLVSKFEPVSKSNFRDLFESIEKDTGIGVVPIENSSAGSVVECYDLFFEYDFEIISELYLKINHVLAVKPEINSISDLDTILSHPQALYQCSKFIESKGLNSRQSTDTAQAAKEVYESKDRSLCAISSQRAANYYGLKTLRTQIQDQGSNTTRFLLVKKKGTSFSFEKTLERGNKSTLIFETRDIPSALYKALGGFATNGVNLKKIESRPKRSTQGFKPIFYIDFEGNLEDSEVKRALEELEFFSELIILLGSYSNASNEEN